LKTSWLNFLPVLCVSLLLVACASSGGPNPEMLPPPPDRQSELTRLYDIMGADDEQAANRAAREAAAGDDRDRRFMANLWGTRTRSVAGARRFGHALSATGYDEEALAWFERGLLHAELDDPLAHWLRYDMARAYLTLGRRDDAVNVLMNRKGTSPLPPELREQYDALLDEAARQ